MISPHSYIGFAFLSIAASTQDFVPEHERTPGAIIHGVTQGNIAETMRARLDLDSASSELVHQSAEGARVTLGPLEGPPYRFGRPLCIRKRPTPPLIAPEPWDGSKSVQD